MRLNGNRASYHALILARLLLCGVVVGATSLRAQEPLEVRPQRDLNFQDVFAGLPKAVFRFDADAAELEVRGEPLAEVEFTFTLPASLLLGGQSLPVQFGADDGGFSTDNDQNNQVGFDPRVTYTDRLGDNGQAFLWLGGLEQAGSTQPAGLYQGTVTLSVAYTGN